MNDPRPMISMEIPARIFNAYKRMRPNEEQPLRVGDTFRLKPGGPMYEIREITYPVHNPS